MTEQELKVAIEAEQKIVIKKSQELMNSDDILSYIEFDEKNEQIHSKLQKLSRQYRKITTDYKMKELDDADHMTLEEFIDCCESGGFINYDGFGYYATQDQQSSITVYPSDITSGVYRSDFTHVMWYNR